MKSDEPWPPLTWNTLWRAWLVATVSWVLTDGTWVLAGGSWKETPFLLELVNNIILQCAYWSWRKDHLQRQAVSEDEPG